ncbi:MAG: hypothetical protein ACK5HT_04015, partial [Draconibacterium sp.]
TTVSSFTNDAGYLTTEVDGSVSNELQALSISNDTIYLSNGGFVKLPAAAVAVEADPAYSGSEAANITAADIANLGNLSGTNTGDQDLSELASQAALGDSTAQVRSEIPDVSGFLTSEADPSVPTGTQAGDMQYWNGTKWINVAAGSEGQVLTFVGGVPTWKTIEPGDGDVKNPITGKIWMDRNLGASQVATKSNDDKAYGDLYQWGRATDGHEKRTSGTTTALATGDIPGGDFITISGSPFDWRNPQNDHLWQGINGTNNPCPNGYHVPTNAEWEAERNSWASQDSKGAFASPLKLSVAGHRFGSNGSLGDVGSSGYYWSSTVDGIRYRKVYFGSSSAYTNKDSRAYGISVRCIKG